jgi:hypothetical protein
VAIKQHFGSPAYKFGSPASSISSVDEPDSAQEFGGRNEFLLNELVARVIAPGGGPFVQQFKALTTETPSAQFPGNSFSSIWTDQLSPLSPGPLSVPTTAGSSFQYGTGTSCDPWSDSYPAGFEDSVAHQQQPPPPASVEAAQPGVKTIATWNIVAAQGTNAVCYM